MRILRTRLPAGACSGQSAGSMFRRGEARGSAGRVRPSALHNRCSRTRAERGLKGDSMSTQLVGDRQLQVEEILGAFDLPAGGTLSGVAYGGSFIQSGTGAVIETRDPSTGNVLGHVRSASEADCSSGIAAAQDPFKSWRPMPA